MYIYGIIVSMSKNKRMIYLWDENVEAYEAIPNKSEWINIMIKENSKEDADVEDKSSEFERKLEKISGRDTANQ